MRRSKKNLAIHAAGQAARIDRLLAERDHFKRQALDNIGALRTTSRELSDLKDEIALHIVAAEHPSTAHSDAASAALALREALEARGIDLRIELGRLDAIDAPAPRERTPAEVRASQTADRIARLCRGVAKARAEATAEKQRADHLQDDLDNALGLNTAAVAMGASWQARAETRMQFDKPTAEEATAP